MEKQHKKFFWQGNHQIGFLSYAKCVCCFLLVFAGAMQTISAAPAGAQSTQQTKKKVVGNIKDENGEALIGVTIAIKGQSTGTVTDINGNFSLEVSQPSVLVVSYIGYTRQFIDYTGQQSLAIQMISDVEKLNEVVVVGYGTQKVKNVTGSIASVDMQRMESLPVANLTQALSGQIAGVSVNPGGSRPGSTDAKITIRQINALAKDGGNSLPLIVIDDVIQVDPATNLSTMDQFNRLDPSEVESITVLRDASAAIYGSRAAQGAIIVRTKRGKEGQVKVTYSGKFEWNDAVSHIKTMDTYNYGLYANSILTTAGKTGSLLFSNTELEKMKSLNYNWLDKAWSGAGAMQHSINVSGGDKKATYFAGASYYDQGANLGSQDYKRYNFRAGTDVKLTNRLKLSATLTANNSAQEKSYTKVISGMNDNSFGNKGGGEQADYMYLLHMPGYVPYSAKVDGVDQWVSPALGPHMAASTQVVNNSIAGWNYFALTNNGSKSVNQDFNYGANFALQYDIPFVKGLSVKATYALTRSSINSEQTQLPFSLALGTNTDKLDRHLYGDTTTWVVRENNKTARVLYDVTTNRSEQANIYINYDRTFGLHEISAMASIERAENSSEFKRQYYENTTSSYNGASSSAGTMIPGTSYMSRSESGALSYLGRVSYNYGSKYLAQFIMRADASTKFAPENYWGLFPTISLGWVASEESWFKNNVKWIDYLKIRASVGKTGNDDIKAWKWKQLYSWTADKGLGFGTNGGTQVYGITPDATPNRNIHWSTDIKYNLGLDFNTLNNRLSFGLDGYFDRTTDLLTDMSGMVGVPLSVGGAYAEQNYGALDMWGTELSINWRDKIGEVKYSIGVNTSLSWNKVTKCPTSGVNYPSANSTIVGQSTILPVWGFKTWKGNEYGDGLLRTDADIDAYWNYLTELATAAGTTPTYLTSITKKSDLKKGMLAYQDLGGNLQADGTVGAPNGQINTNGEDYAKLVKRNITYGISTNMSLSWKSFSWSTQISTSWGGYASIDRVGQGTSNIIWSHESFWTDMYNATSNVNGKYANMYYSQNYSASDYWQVSSFRCFVRNMNFAYALPKKLVAKAGIESAKLSLSGNNLWDLFNPYPDHYRNMYDNSNSSYPTLRTWALGVNLTF
ncbi:MAG: TonB-dependent receptor [Paludibacter sp.]|nr:TonB-dependent receptor [Paludibacter sp.]